MSGRVARWLSSLSAKYIAVFILLVAVPAVGTSAYLLFSSYQDNKRALVRLQQEKAKAVAITIDRYFLDLTRRLKTMTGMHLDFSALGSQLDPLLADHAIDAFYVDENGRKTLAEDGGGLRVVKGNHLHDRSIQLARKERVYFGSVYAPQPRSNPEARSMEVVVAEFGSEGFVHSGTGVFGETLELVVIQDLVRQMRLGTSGYVYVVDSRGVPIAHPNSAAFTKRSLAFPQVTRALASSKTGSTVGRNFRGQKVLSTWATVGPLGWKVFVEQPESAAFAPVRGKIWRTALLLAAFLAAGIGLSVLLAHRLARPVKQMRTAARRIGAGAYDERIQLRRQDELGDLADDLNRMAASLQASVQVLEQRVEERTRELQQALAELSRKGRELEVASEHKSHFLANMSHELRTPLNAIIGFSELLELEQVGPLSEQQRAYLDDVLDAAHHLLALINEILDLSKVEAGLMELELADVSLRPTLESGLTMNAERAARTGVALELSVEPEEITVRADERKLRQVVFNLLSNAVKFTPPDGHVDVSARLMNGEVVVAVADTGPGIAPEDQELIFEEFRQAAGPDGLRDEGTGLGLPLAQKLIELHGGRLWVESSPGSGSTFRFTLPVETRS